MRYMIDTNVICETIKPKPNDNVIKWFDNILNTELTISVITLGEIQKGIERIKHDDNKKAILSKWLEYDLKKWFGERIIPIDEHISVIWGSILAKYNMPAIDSLIAATCLKHNLTLVTRNIKDFLSIKELDFINPWE